LVADRLLWKRRIGAAMHAIARSPSRRVVLLYHAVGTGAWSVAKERFSGQMRWLAQAARVVPLETLLSSEHEPGLRVAVTFDDGYSSVQSAALPVLNALGVTATVYLNTGWIGERERRRSHPALGHYAGQTFLRWCDAEALARAAWTIGSHGIEHLDLSRSPTEVCEKELVQSREEITRRLGVACNHFAYTWGRSNKRLRAQVAQCGYKSAASGVHGPLRNGFDALAFPRINVSAEYTLDDFKAIVRGDWDYLGWWQRAKAVEFVAKR